MDGNIEEALSIHELYDTPLNVVQAQTHEENVPLELDTKMENLMSFLLANTSFAVIPILIIALIIYWPSYPNIKGIKHIGIDPGLFGLRLAQAKRWYARNGRKDVQHAYNTDKDTIYFIQTSDIARFLIPPRYLPELRNLPEKQLSHRHSIVDRWAGEYNGMDTVMASTLHADVCRGQLTQHLGKSFLQS